MPRVWWCNQTRCWDDERPAGLVCSHVAATEGGMKYRRMVSEVRAGDITVHYRSGRWLSVVALSRALTDAVEGTVDLRQYGVTGKVCWEVPGPGWRFKADYHDLANPIPKNAFIEELNELEIEDGPLVSSAQIRQAYFMRFTIEGLRILRRTSTEDWPKWAEIGSVPQYWVVGASWGGREDQFEVFIREGYWRLGWDDDEQPDQAARRNQIRPGDRIAIKKISTHPDIEIRAVGVVKKIDPTNDRVHVRWVASDLHHQVFSRGCYKSIHGPYDPDDEWTRDVFRLDDLEHLLDEDNLPDIDDGSLLAQEGAKRWRLHLVTERNRKNVERKKAQVKLEKGSLECEVCGFDFARFYGDLGADFCEVHHKILLAHVDQPVRLKLDELAIVCSNCHRMIHRTNPMISVEDFRNQQSQRAT